MISEPIIQNLPNGYKFVWCEGMEQTTGLKLSRLQESTHSGIQAEIEVTISNWPLISGIKFNLLSQQARKQMAKRLSEMAPLVPENAGTKLFTVDWDSLVEQVCVKALEFFRSGEPVIKIGSIPIRNQPKYRIQPLILESEPNMVYGDGGVGKSNLACLWAVMVQHNIAGPNLIPQAGNVLYLDWETSQYVIKERIDAVKKGLGVEVCGEDILYRFCERSLMDDIEQIQNIVYDNKIDFVIVDSVGLSCGGDSEKSEVVINFFKALRTLRKTSLLLDHISKTSDGKTPFGSIYKRNIVRSAFELKHVQEVEDYTLHLGLYHRKCNDAPLIKPMGFKIDFFMNGEYLDEIKVESTDLNQFFELSKGLSLKQQIENVLKKGALTIDDMADTLERNKGSIKTELYRNKNTFLRLEDGEWGLLQ